MIVTSYVSPLQTAGANSSIVAKLATEPLSSKNKYDTRNIMKALLMPGQIMIEMDFDVDDPINLAVVGALVAKASFSASPATRNITRDTVLAPDRVFRQLVSILRIL